MFLKPEAEKFFTKRQQVLLLLCQICQGGWGTASGAIPLYGDGFCGSFLFNSSFRFAFFSPRLSSEQTNKKSLETIKRKKQNPNCYSGVSCASMEKITLVFHRKNSERKFYPSVLSCATPRFTLIHRCFTPGVLMGEQLRCCLFAQAVLRHRCRSQFCPNCWLCVCHWPWFLLTAWKAEGNAKVGSALCMCLLLFETKLSGRWEESILNEYLPVLSILLSL